MLPGFSCPGSVWNETITHLEGQNTYYIVSYAGFNGLPPIQMPWYTAIRNELISYIRSQGLRDVNIIGHSMGGTLAIDIAAALPDHIRNIVLVDALPCMRALMMPGVTAEQVQYENPYNKQLMEMPDSMMLKNVKMMAAAMTMLPSKADTLVQWMMAADRKTYIYGYTDLLKTDLRDDLPRVRANTLILGASFPGKETVLKTFNEQYAQLANKQVEIAPESKHFIMFDQPEWLYAKINTFFSK